MPVLQSGQYVARNADGTPKDPQPGDVEITDAFGNVFDNFNEYGVGPGKVAFYDADNVLKDPQPAYQNLDYVSYLVDNTPDPITWLPDAAQWVPRGVDNQVRTVEPYVRSPLFPDGIPVDRTAPTIVVVLQVEASEALIVTENDVNEIELELNPLDFVSIRNFIAPE